MNLARLKAFTLSIDGKGNDAKQAHDFLSTLDMEIFHEVIETPGSWVNLEERSRYHRRLQTARHPIRRNDYCTLPRN